MILNLLDLALAKLCVLCSFDKDANFFHKQSIRLTKNIVVNKRSLFKISSDKNGILKFYSFSWVCDSGLAAYLRVDFTDPDNYRD